MKGLAQVVVAGYEHCWLGLILWHGEIAEFTLPDRGAFQQLRLENLEFSLWRCQVYRCL